MADTSETTIVRVPADAWCVLEETLEMDARSSAFDPELRRQITAALGRVEDVSLLKIVVPLVTTADLADAVDELFNGPQPPRDQDGRLYSREQVARTLSAWLGTLCGEVLNNLALHAQVGVYQPEMELPSHSDRDLDAEARGEAADLAYERARERAAA